MENVDITDLLCIYSGIPAKLEIKENPATLGIGRSAVLGVRIFPEKITKPVSVSWSSVYPDIATVDESGKVTGKKAGRAVISVNCVSAPSVVSSCQIDIVEVKLESMAF